MNNIFRFTADIPNLTTTYNIVNIRNIINDLRFIEIDFPRKTIFFTRVSHNKVLYLHQIDIQRINNQIYIFIGTNNNRFAFIKISNINEPIVGLIMNRPETNNFEDAMANDNLISRLNNNINLPNYFLCNSNNALNLNLRALNNFYIRQCINRSYRVLLAWGENGSKPNILNNIKTNKLYIYGDLLINHRPRSIARVSNEIMNSIFDELRANNVINNYINNIHNINEVM